MSWQCDRCLHYTADGQEHECINDRVEQLEAANEKLRAEAKRLTTQFQVTTVDLVNAEAELAAARASLNESEEFLKRYAVDLETAHIERDALKAALIEAAKNLRACNEKGKSPEFYMILDAEDAVKQFGGEL